MADKVVMYTKNNCTFCERAKVLLKKTGVQFEEISLEDPIIREAFIGMYPEVRTAPQILVDDQLLGGYDQLRAYYMSCVGHPEADTFKLFPATIWNT